MFPRLSSARRTAAAALLLAISATGCLSSTVPDYKPSNPATETYAASLGVDLSQMTKLDDALYYQDLVVGTGAQVTPGKPVSVSYTGWLVNGTQFDSNVGKTPFTFTLQAAQVIAGWDFGIVGMQVGGTRRLVIGSDLAYGPNARYNSLGQLVIPSSATLVFEVKVLSAE